MRLAALEAGEVTPPPDPPPVGVVCGDDAWGVPPRSGTIHNALVGGGTRTTVWDLNNNLLNGQRAYAGTITNDDLVTFVVPDSGPSSNPEKRPITGVGNGNDISFWGGFVQPTYLIPGVTPWESGDTTPEYHGNIALCTGKGLRQWIRHFACQNVGDGIAIGDAAPGTVDECDDWLIQGCALLDCQDDGVQNDFKNSGTVCDCYISARMCFAARPAATSASRLVFAASRVFTVRNSLVWCKGFSSPDIGPVGGSLGDPCTFGILKRQVATAELPDGSTRGMSFAFHDNIFLWKGERSEAATNGAILTSSDAAKITAQSNNILLMPNQSSGLPPNWPASAMTSFQYIYGANCAQVWNPAVDAFIARNPEVKVHDPGYL